MYLLNILYSSLYHIITFILHTKMNIITFVRKYNMSQDHALLVAAIDFGTTYSGYAFSFRHEFEQDPLRVCSSSWSSGSGTGISLKTSSCILFRPDGQFESFGFEAEDRYSDLTLDKEHHAWFYFRRFKMKLYDSKVCLK